MGQGVFGPALSGSDAHQPGDLPLIQTALDVSSSDVNQLSSLFAQMVYDMTWVPLRDVRALSTSGIADANAVNAALVPDGVTATWQVCDGTNGTPDLTNVVIAGADPYDPTTPTNTGDTATAGKTSSDATGITETDEANATNVVAHGHGDSLAFSLPNHVHNTGDGTNFVTSGNNYAQGDAGNTVLHQDKTTTGNPTTLPACSKSGGVTDHAGSDNPHSHGVTDPGHDHDTGLPPRTYLEYWMRVA